MNWNLKEGFHKVNFGEHLVAEKITRESANVRDRISIRNSY